MHLYVTTNSARYIDISVPPINMSTFYIICSIAGVYSGPSRIKPTHGEWKIWPNYTREVDCCVWFY